MFDINLIREQPDLVREALRSRSSDPGLVDQVLALDVERRALLGEVETLKAERNAASKEISKMKDAEERKAKIEQMREVGDKITALDNHVREVDEALLNKVSAIPNLPLPETPYGKDEHENVVLRTEGEPRQCMTLRPCPIGTWGLPSGSSISNRALKSQDRASMCSREPGRGCSAR